MSDAELVFTNLAELSTRQIAETMESKGLEKIKFQQKEVDGWLKMPEKNLNQKLGKKLLLPPITKP